MEQAVAFKEWEVVCEALGRGTQCVLLRKGGIHEGREGFSFKHERFYLFPTRFHEQAGQVRISCDFQAPEWEPGDMVPLRWFCEAVWARTLTDWEQVRRLAPFHVWKEEVLRQRFGWGKEDRIHCALVRVHRMLEPWTITYEKKHGGCRTWVDLPEVGGEPPGGMTPVVPDAEFADQQRQVEAVLDH